ncbi:MND1-interacting protein 1 [Dichanthelium oligosanthes]|uniref:MND1-interacting protein 1 n=1 Tax=Dichanthelium oligosanthes TaxID=888268 RepID=A0A1E5UYG7_9POAL|nr:MND1-interacting protein 1 [Dichanthelium oligosanthes]
MAGQPRDRGSRASRKGRSARAGPAPAPPPASDPDPAAGEDAAPWLRATADELEARLLKRLDEAYAAALARLADLGHGEEASLEAVLRAGHCYGKLNDPVSNIVANARTYLSDPGHAGGAGGFADLRRLEEYSLAGLVCLLQSSQPTLTRAEALGCLLSSDLRLEAAIAIGCSLNGKPVPAAAPAESEEHPPAVAETPQRGYIPYHNNTAAATAAQDPALFDPETFMRLAIRQGPAAATISCLKAAGWSRSSGSAPEGQPKESFAKKISTEELIESVVVELEALDIDKKDPPDANPDPKNQMVRDLIKQTREMEAQLKERREWAQGKAIQAARKLGTDLTELRVLRMEHDENQRRKKEKQVMEDDTMKRLAHLENELKKKSGQLDRSNATVQRLEMENAEIRAEMEAAKLSASETERQCQGLLRKEKKDTKKLEVWERQKAKLKEDIAECKTKITQAERELSEVNKAIKNMEIKIREDTRAKEENMALLEEERRKKEAAKADSDRRLEELRRKKEVESQCYKDDLRRLQDELSRLQKSAGANQPAVPSTNPPVITNRSTVRAPKQQPIQRPPPASNRPLPQPTQKSSRRRDCVVCQKEEACIILLQCAHQVLCVGCNKLHEDKGVARCPCCSAKIEERIRVFGASSN